MILTSSIRKTFLSHMAWYPAHMNFAVESMTRAHISFLKLILFVETSGALKLPATCHP